MQGIQGDALRGHLENLVLAVLERGEGHGLDVLKRLEAAGCGLLALKEGTSYPALYRLEASGLIKGKWEDDSRRGRGPRRRIYRLTPKGKRRLAKSREEFSVFAQTIGGHFGGGNMNTQMSAVAELELRKHVERAVRPVPARERRKMKMREELFAHLTAIFFEELDRRRNEESAVGESCRRFGAPAEITAELNHSIGAAERLGGLMELYERRTDKLFSRWPGESLVRYLLRGALGITALTIGTMVVVCGIIWSIGGEIDAGSLLLLPRLFPVMIVGNWTALFAAYSIEGMKARGVRRLALLLVQSGLWSLLLTAVLGWFWSSIGDRPISASFIALLAAEIWAVVAVMLVAIALLCDTTRRLRQAREAWTNLEIGE